MSKRKQRRGSNQRVVVNPYHVHAGGTSTVLPMHNDDYGLFDPVSMARSVGKWLLVSAVSLACVATIVGVSL